MIDEKKIKQAVVSKLKKGGFSVLASEITEGFKRPAVFATVTPYKCELLNAYREQLEVGVTISYYSQTETNEECSEAAAKIRKEFMYSPLEVGGRKLTIQNMEFDIEDKVLYSYFELDIIQETINTVDADDVFATLETEGF